MFPFHEAIPVRINFSLYLLHILLRQVLKPPLCSQELFNSKTPGVVRDAAGTARFPWGLISQIPISTKITKDLAYFIEQDKQETGLCLP